MEFIAKIPVISICVPVVIFTEYCRIVGCRVIFAVTAMVKLCWMPMAISVMLKKQMAVLITVKPYVSKMQMFKVKAG